MKISDLPRGNATTALPLPWFPARFLAVIWRNWNLVAPEKIAEVLETSPENISACAQLMGLHNDDRSLNRWRTRGFQTIIRRNWDLLDYDQLLKLLDWTPDQLFFTLKEDDFFFYKLGLNKVQCPRLLYRPLSAAEKLQLNSFRELVQNASGHSETQEPPFDFLDHYGQVEPLQGTRQDFFKQKFIYSYSALYGDPLLDDDLTSYPEAMLKDYAACGVNGIWLQAVLYTLVPWLGGNESVSAQWERRLGNLKKLNLRAQKYGLKIYLYLNEPRSMPEEFFLRHPQWRGVRGEHKDYALCTSAPGVLAALSAGVERLYREIPTLGDVFSITMSENLTHCRSKGGSCPRCDGHSAAELCANVNLAIASGMRRAGSSASLIAYAWSWEPEWMPEVITRMGAQIAIMTVSESRLPTQCLNFQSEVHDYSISQVGPGELATRIWTEAQRVGAPCVAKIQVNASWELAALPYLPVPDLVEEHLNRLKEHGVDGLMLSWSLGGFPGGNLGLLNCTREELAQQLFGACAPQILKVWSEFSNAFRKFPFNNVFTLYFTPQNFGPAVLLYPFVTGHQASMIGFPFDDLDTWCGKKDNPAATKLPNPMPPETLLAGFQQLVAGWIRGLAHLNQIAYPQNPQYRKNLAELRRISEAAYCHFASCALQIKFALLKRRNSISALRPIICKEKKLAERLLKIVQQDSRIGFESSNHYFYTQNDLLEKILNCNYILRNNN